ncbi:MAG TPA: hypothetical protein VKY31_08500 [Terriglobia bacterium]|nr:hypothetical protein [Terriglobia bacterium]
MYHLLTWFNTFNINERAFWKRVAIASAICHVILAAGFFIFSYYDSGGANFGAYVFNESNFWNLVEIFDTAAMVTILLLFAGFDRAGINPPGLIVITMFITFVVGTLQWFFIGGGIGALLERFFMGLRTPDPEDEEWD